MCLQTVHHCAKAHASKCSTGTSVYHACVTVYEAFCSCLFVHECIPTIRVTGWQNVLYRVISYAYSYAINVPWCLSLHRRRRNTAVVVVLICVSSVPICKAITSQAVPFLFFLHIYLLGFRALNILPSY